TPTRAFVISVLNAVVTRLGTIAIGIALARLLGPEQFGTYAVAFVALMAVLSFNELGVSLAIVRWPGDPKEIAATVTTISTACSIVLFAGSYMMAPYFTAAMGNEAATDVVRALAFCIVLNGLVATPAAVLQRNFRQGQRMIIDQVNVWLGAGVSLVLVIMGMGAMSLAVGRVLASLISAFFFLFYSSFPDFLSVAVSLWVLQEAGETAAGFWIAPGRRQHGGLWCGLRRPVHCRKDAGPAEM